MKASAKYLGSLEQIVLLAVMRLGPNAYGVTVRQEIESRTGRDVSMGAVYATLKRLRSKGYLSSSTGDATPERGGRAKEFFRIEAPGKEALVNTQEAVKAMTSGMSRHWKTT